VCLAADDDAAVGHRIDLNRLLYEAKKKKSASLGSAAIESERKLVKVIVEMLMTHSPVKRPHQPSLEKRNDVVHTRQQLIWSFFLSLEKRKLVDVAFPFQRRIAQPRVRMYGAAWFNAFLDERDQTVRRGIWYSLHANPTDAFPILLSRNDYQDLPFRLTAANATFRSAEICLVNLNSTGKSVPPRSYHCSPQLMQPGPGSLVAAQSKNALESEGIAPRFLVRHEPHSLKPSAKGFPRLLEDRSGSRRRLVLARCAAQQASGTCPGTIPATGRAMKTIWPPNAPQIVSTRFLGSKPTVKFLKCSRIINSANRLKVIAHHNILRLRELNG